MKKIFKAGAYKCKQFLLLLIAVAVAVMAMPMGLIGGSRTVAADVVTGEHDGGTPSVKASAGETFKLTLYYHREDEKYTGWNLWSWAPGVEGSQYDAEPVTQEVTVNNATKQTNWIKFTVERTDITPNGENVIGFIVRLSSPGLEWGAKAVEDDLWVPLSRFEEGEAVVYMADKLDELYTNAQDAYDHKVIRRVSTAYFRKLDSIRVSFNKGVTASSVLKIKDSEGTVIRSLVSTTDTADPTQTFKLGATFVDFQLPDDFEVDFTETYTFYDEPAGEFDPELNFPSKEINKFDLYDTAEFKALYDYKGELGVSCSTNKTDFAVWAPISASVNVVLYAAGDGGEALREIPMTKGANGEWTATVEENLNGKYYTYKLEDKAGRTKEVVDPYARSGGKNGVRGMILDLASTNPEGWDDASKHSIPDYGTSAKNMAQAVIWEAHVRDLSINENSNVSEVNRGKFLGLTETASAANGNKQTPLDYIKSLGVTQVHFQPLFDFASVDESFTQATYLDGTDPNAKSQFNWGYDPLNYNMPEGSYSSDPSDGFKRVNEMKQMIMALHNAGIQVIMDVVYNHVSSANDSNFEALMPGYFFRRDANGKLYNGSGCGNETASNRYMFRRFMIDSVKYWTEEYKIDGFRFDLMALHDIDTMNELYKELEKINPDVIVYGEGWTAGTSGLASENQATLANARKMPNIAFFDDIFRDGMKGSVFDIRDTGFASGKLTSEAAVYVGATGGTNALGAQYYAEFSKSAFANAPTQNISYASCHDNAALWDKLNASVNKDRETLKAMNRVAAAAVLTSQGMSFMLAGEEMLRTKHTPDISAFDNKGSTYLTDPNYCFANDSYKSPDSVNAIDWSMLETNKDMVDFYKQLIAIKTTFPQFHLTTAAQIKNLVFSYDQSLTDGVTSYAVKDPASDNYAVVLFNMNDTAKTVNIPNGRYSVYVNGDKANAKEALSTFSGSKFKVGAYSAVVMVSELNESAIQKWSKVAPVAADEEPDSNLGLALGLGIGIPAAVLIAGGAVFGVMYGKKKKSKAGDKAEDNAEPEQPAADETPEPEPEQPEQSEEQPENPETDNSEGDAE